MTKAKTENRRIVRRLTVSFIILALGFGGMQFLASFKKPPAQRESRERRLKVETRIMTPQDVRVRIEGNGEARAVEHLLVAPEVSGRLIEVHKNAEVGGIIAKGALIFAIDRRNFQAALDEAKATAAKLSQTVKLLAKQQESDQKRLRAIRRNRQLAKAEFERVRRLFAEDQVGTRSAVEAREQAYNNAVDQESRLQQTLDLYPLRISEGRSALAAAQARVQVAQANLQRCTVRAPFRGRVTQGRLQVGSYVRAGEGLITLADDSLLEIQTAIDSGDARRWLVFNKGAAGSGRLWFADPQPVSCQVTWIEDSSVEWQGRLHRVVRFDASSRTLTLAVRVRAAPEAVEGALPLVEGMFCRVRIPGRLLRGVFALPPWAVSFDDTVYAVRDGRLSTVKVHSAWSSKEAVYVDRGLRAGDEVIVTRLSNPMEGALLDVDEKHEGGGR